MNRCTVFVRENNTETLHTSIGEQVDDTAVHSVVIADDDGQLLVVELVPDPRYSQRVSTACLHPDTYYLHYSRARPGLQGPTEVFLGPRNITILRSLSKSS